MDFITMTNVFAETSARFAGFYILGYCAKDSYNRIRFYYTIKKWENL